jgi:hypothetical protein
VFESLFTHPLWAYRNGTFAFASFWPLWLLGLLIAFGTAAVAFTLWRRRRGSGQRLTAGQLVLLGSLQTIFVSVILCLLWRPVLNVERVRDRENVLAVALDASASMAYGEQDRSRLQQAVAALQGDTLDALRKIFDVQLYGFAQQAQPIPTLQSVPPPGPQTRIGDSLVQILQTAGSAPLAGIVLFSDGAENGESLSEERLTEIASYGVPIHTVGLGPEINAHDLELERVDIASVAPAGATVAAQVGIRHDGAGKTRLRVYDRDRLVVARGGRAGHARAAFRARSARGRNQRHQQRALACHGRRGRPALDPVRRRRAALGIQVPASRGRWRSGSAAREPGPHDTE